MAYVKEHPPSEVYHLTKKENLNSILEDGMIRRFEAELGEPATVIATGGISQFVVPLCQRKMIQEKDLLLKGMDYLYHKNRKR